ncbi:putative protease with chaperone activity [Pseudomonas aeruginosa]|nr:putative protease with chaperone activity [Pseudomonas aeruginosa]
MSTLLALDTSTEACSVALLHEGRALSHYEVIPRLHAQRLLPMVRDLLDEAGVALSAVDAIAFGRGPGAFTGVRIAIGVVQGLAFALQRPVLAVSDLAILAQRAYREQGAERVAAAIDARMDEVYWGCYQLQQGEMRLAGSEAVLPPERVAVPVGRRCRGLVRRRHRLGLRRAHAAAPGRAGREPAAACRGLAQPGRLRLGARRRRGGGTGAAGVPARQRGDAEKSALKMPRSGNCQAFRGWLECGDFPGF